MADPWTDARVAALLKTLDSIAGSLKNINQSLATMVGDPNKPNASRIAAALEQVSKQTKF
jgi:hypothetical protein